MNITRMMLILLMSCMLFCMVVVSQVVFTETINRPVVKPPVVQMFAPTVRVSAHGANGSGVIIYGKDYKYRVITNFHVVEQAIRMTPPEVDGILGKVEYKMPTVFIEAAEPGNYSAIYPGTIIGLDPSVDLALIEFEASANLEVATLVSKEMADEVQILDKVYSVGCQLGDPPIATEGIVSNFMIKDDILSIITSAPIALGASGSAVFIERNSKYYVLSINRAIETDSRGTIYPHYSVSIMPYIIMDFLCNFSFEIEYLECEGS